MTDTDPRTENSLLADPEEDGTQATTDLVAAAADALTAPQLGRMMVNVGRTVADEEDLLQLLQQFVEIAHQAIEGADSSGVTIDMGGRTYTAVHTDKRTLEVDIQQYNAGDGPCLHASRTGQVVRTDADAAQEAWPEFAAAARAEGIRSFLAAPLFANEQAMGSFNLYSRQPATFDRIDADILDLLTTAVSRAIADFARFQSANRIAETIERALENRAPIEQAKGMLMALHGIDADAAFDRLRNESQARNVKLHVIAHELVDRLSQPGPAAMA